jgi:hypothetical protein
VPPGTERLRITRRRTTLTQILSV